jgi:hypothetical protein
MGEEGLGKTVFLGGLATPSESGSDIAIVGISISAPLGVISMMRGLRGVVVMMAKVCVMTRVVAPLLDLLYIGIMDFVISSVTFPGLFNWTVMVCGPGWSSSTAPIPVASSDEESRSDLVDLSS